MLAPFNTQTILPLAASLFEQNPEFSVDPLRDFSSSTGLLGDYSSNTEILDLVVSILSDFGPTKSKRQSTGHQDFILHHTIEKNKHLLHHHHHHHHHQHHHQHHQHHHHHLHHDYHHEVTDQNLIPKVFELQKKHVVN